MPAMIPDAIETFKDAMLRTFAAQLRAERPGLTHARSFQLAQEQHPDLREEFPPDPEEQLKPTDKPAFMASGKNQDVNVTLKTILEKYIPQRVEATPHRLPDDEPPSKVGAIKVYGQGIPL
jgi:hypothetical protein